MCFERIGSFFHRSPPIQGDSGSAESNPSETISTFAENKITEGAGSCEKPLQAYNFVEEKVGGLVGTASYLAADGCVSGGRKVRRISYAIFSPAARTIYLQAKNTARFIKDNWDKLTLYFLAWAVVIGLSALVYSFSHGGLTSLNLVGGLKAVSLPLTIGIGCGLAFGAILQIMIMNGCKSNFTFWNALNNWLKNHLDLGTGQILIAVAVTVFLALAHLFPYATGAVFGIVVGSQLAMKIANGLDLGSSPQEITKKLKYQLDQIKKQLEILQKKAEQSQDSEEAREIRELREKLEILQKQLEDLQKNDPNRRN